MVEARVAGGRLADGGELLLPRALGLQERQVPATPQGVAWVLRSTSVEGSGSVNHAHSALSSAPSPEMSPLAMYARSCSSVGCSVGGLMVI